MSESNTSMAGAEKLDSRDKLSAQSITRGTKNRHTFFGDERGKKKVTRAKSGIAPYLMVAPAVIWVLVFSLWPFIRTIGMAFTDARPMREARFVGIDNFVQMFSDERFLYALTTCIVYVLLCVPLLTILPLIVSLLVGSRLPGLSFFRTTYYFPVVASAVAVAIIWKWIADSDGLLVQALNFMGLANGSVEILTDRWRLLFCAVTLTVWKGIGYYMVIYLAALANVPRELHEAAALDGANFWTRFRVVTVPAVRGPILLISALVCVSAMRIFTELFVLSNGTGGPGGKDMSMVMMIQSLGKGLRGQIGYASAWSIALFILTVLPLCGVAYANYGHEIRAFLKKNRKQRSAVKKEKSNA